MLDEATVATPSNGALPRAFVVHSELVHDMMQRCASQTARGLNDQFGISWNTWSKLRKGQPIRRSVALRLVSRVLSVEGNEGDPMRYLLENRQS